MNDYVNKNLGTLIWISIIPRQYMKKNKKDLKFILKVSVFSTYLKLQHYDLNNNSLQGLSSFYRRILFKLGFLNKLSFIVCVLQFLAWEVWSCADVKWWYYIIPTNGCFRSIFFFRFLCYSLFPLSVILISSKFVTASCISTGQSCL